MKNGRRLGEGGGEGDESRETFSTTRWRGSFRRASTLVLPSFRVSDPSSPFSSSK